MIKPKPEPRDRKRTDQAKRETIQRRQLRKLKGA